MCKIEPIIPIEYERDWNSKTKENVQNCKKVKTTDSFEKVLAEVMDKGGERNEKAFSDFNIAFNGKYEFRNKKHCLGDGYYSI